MNATSQQHQLDLMELHQLRAKMAIIEASNVSICRPTYYRPVQLITLDTAFHCSGPEYPSVYHQHHPGQSPYINLSRTSH